MFKTIIRTLNILLFILFFSCLYAQKEGYVWCFGDSALINFNYSPAVVLTNYPILTEEASSSISDKNGNLLFYISAMYEYQQMDFFYSHLINKYKSKIKNSDSIRINASSTQGALILPLPNNLNVYYLFHQGKMESLNCYPYTETYRYYFSIVDISKDGGKGEVISKNNILIDDWSTEKMTAIKHGNGRDWWIIMHGINDIFYKVLLSPYGIDTILIQNIGPSFNELIWGGCVIKDIGQMASSPDGAKLALVTLSGNIDIFDFDRCNGDISNWQPINPQGLDSYYGCAFSPNGNYLYVANAYSPCGLYQYDLTTSDISLSKITISQNDSNFYFGQMKLASDGKIYITNYCSDYLHVIYNPNSSGLLCDFEANAINFAGKKISLGLPNIPNFELGTLVGSACDTIPIIQPEEKPETLFIPNIFSPNNDGQNDVFYLYSTNIKTLTLMIFNRWGEMVFETNSINNGWDGTFKGKPVQVGVYTYYIEAGLMSGEKYIKRGSVSLVR